MTDVETYTVDEVASILRVTPQTVRRLIKAGKLKAFPVGSQLRIRKDVLEQFMSQG